MKSSVLWLFIGIVTWTIALSSPHTTMGRQEIIAMALVILPLLCWLHADALQLSLAAGFVIFGVMAGIYTGLSHFFPPISREWYYRFASQHTWQIFSGIHFLVTSYVLRDLEPGSDSKFMYAAD
jgi:hypothetical protein